MLSLSLCSFAIPAKPGLKRQITLTDGTTVNATLVGDEHAHYWIGTDGNAYQTVSGDVFHRIDLQVVKQRAAERRSAANKQRTHRLAPHKIGEVGSITGKKKGLIILVNFSDVAFQSANNNALYNRIANEKNFSYGKFKGSMYDYFYDQSEGQFELKFDVVGPVTVSKNQSYYGENDNDGNDKHPAEMVIEALNLADPQVNYTDYDWNGDGEVEQVYVVYADKGAADGGAANTIWPHEYNLYSAAHYGDGEGPQKLDGVWINTYACGAELNGTSGEIAGIGTMCHEFSHCLGYPDFYDIDYSGGQGMFEWDLMDSGSYNDDGYRPAGYTSYERWMAGWKEPIELTEAQNISNMGALQDYGSNTYIIYNEGNRNEYFLLENRQKKKWDTDLPGAGLLILHVDYDATVWSKNQPNDDPSHQRMTWIPADNQYQHVTYQGRKYYSEAGAANDPFPYGSANAFGKNTTPAATLYNKNEDSTYYLDASVENIIQNSNGTISFRFAPEVKKLTLTATPASGIINYMQEVTLTASNPNAEIYCTFDGTEPTKNDFLYDPPLQIDRSLTLKAKAFLDGYEDSETLTREYQVKTVTLSVSPNASDLLPTGTEITLTAEPSDAKIYYTIDGSEPTETSNLYSVPIVAEHSFTLRAKAFYGGYKDSEEMNAFFNITSLNALNTNPLNDSIIFNKHIIPSISFNSNIKEGENFNRISLLKDGCEVEGEPIISENILYFVPNSHELEAGDYNLWVPVSALCDVINNPNLEEKASFYIRKESQPVIVANSNYSYVLKKDGTLWAWGSNYGKLPIKIFDDVISVAAGTYHHMVVKNDGTLWTWGENSYGELGDGTTINRASPQKVLENVISIAAGYKCSFAILSDNTLWACGGNEKGSLGNGSTNNSSAWLKVLDDVSSVRTFWRHTLAIKRDGTLWAWGENNYGQVGDGTTTTRNLPVKILENVISVTTGYYHSLAIKADGSLWAWGRNDYGQLGNGNLTNRVSPVKVLDNIKSVAAGGNHSLAISNDSSLWIWGRNSYGQLGDKTLTSKSSPTKVLENVVLIAGGENHSSALMSDGSLWSWGNNDVGQHGDGTTVDVTSPVEVLDNAEFVKSGSRHSLVIKKDASLWACGHNSEGQLGNGTNSSCLEFTKVLDDVISVAAGGYHSLSIKSDNTLWAWGDNTYGRLGDGTTTNRNVPVKILDNVASISAGWMYTLAVKNDGSLWAWGYNGDGYLGDGTTTNRKSPVHVLDNVIFVAAGDYHSLAVKDDNTLWAWGANSAGQLGNGKSTRSVLPIKVLDDVVSVAAGQHFSLAIKSDGTLWAWGLNTSGQLGDGTTINRNIPTKILDGVNNVEAGNKHSLAIKNDGSLWAWGENSNGQLGDGTKTNRQFPVKILDKVMSSGAGADNSFAIKSDGELVAWGGNSDAQLGVNPYGFACTYKQINKEIPILQDLSLKSKINIEKSQKILIIPNSFPKDADYQTMTWGCSDENIATISPRGIVTGISPGEATLTVKVTSKEGTEFTAQCIVTVTENIKGDVNGDNIVDREDAIAVANYILKKPSPSFNPTAADVNGDGIINITDAIAIENIIKQNN